MLCKGRPPGHCGVNVKSSKQSMKALTIHQDVDCRYSHTLLGGTNIYAALDTFNFKFIPIQIK